MQMNLMAVFVKVCTTAFPRYLFLPFNRLFTIRFFINVIFQKTCNLFKMSITGTEVTFSHEQLFFGTIHDVNILTIFRREL